MLYPVLSDEEKVELEDKLALARVRLTHSQAAVESYKGEIEQLERQLGRITQPDLPMPIPEQQKAA